MIINIRGGSGAGKSTIIRSVMEHFDQIEPHHVPGRKQPVWYDMRSSTNPDARPVRLLGHYETECGGCDTLSKNVEDPDEGALDYIHRLVREAHIAGFHVLYEGLMLTTVHRRLGEIVEDYPGHVVVVCVDSDLDTCLMGISERRARRKADGATATQVLGTLTETTVKNNVGKLRSHHKTAAILKQRGATVLRGDREQSLAHVEEALGL